jgi:hypothetical protein
LDTWIITGVVLRGYLKTLEQEGWLAGVRAVVPERTRKLIDKPPLVISSVDGTVLEEIVVAIEQLKGPEAPRRIARATANASFGPVLTTLMKTTLRNFGGSPAALFSRMGGLSPLMMRNIEFSWTKSGDHSGTFGARFPKPVPAPSFRGWEGICEFVLDFCETPGEVGAHRRFDEGRRFEIDVRWEGRASVT